VNLTGEGAMSSDPTPIMPASLKKEPRSSSSASFAEDDRYGLPVSKATADPAAVARAAKPKKGELFCL